MFNENNKELRKFHDITESFGSKRLHEMYAESDTIIYLPEPLDPTSLDGMTYHNFYHDAYANPGDKRPFAKLVVTCDEKDSPVDVSFLVIAKDGVPRLLSCDADGIYQYYAADLENRQKKGGVSYQKMSKSLRLFVDQTQSLLHEKNLKAETARRLDEDIRKTNKSLVQEHKRQFSFAENGLGYNVSPEMRQSLFRQAMRNKKNYEGIFVDELKEVILRKHGAKVDEDQIAVIGMKLIESRSN